MTILTSQPIETYRNLAADIFQPNGFTPSDNFSLRNARAMMWMSQLAYETGLPDPTPILEEIRQLWGFDSIIPISDQAATVWGRIDTRALVAERPGVTIVAFRGTDPGIWQNIVTDLDTKPSGPLNIHQGFGEALGPIFDEVKEHLVAAQSAGRAIFITGHSLGGALAALAALRTTSEITPTAIYTFGMPRVGGTKFVEEYNKTLGAITYRLVRGRDVVASVPMSGLGFRHVGHFLWCRKEKFDAADLVTSIDSDLPSFSYNAFNSLKDGLTKLFSWNLFTATGPGPIGELLQFLPPPVRDHVMDRYYAALAP